MFVESIPEYTAGESVLGFAESTGVSAIDHDRTAAGVRNRCTVAGQACEWSSPGDLPSCAACWFVESSHRYEESRSQSDEESRSRFDEESKSRFDVESRFRCFVESRSRFDVGSIQ